MTWWFLLIGLLAGSIEGLIINDRTRRGLPDMKHNVSVAVRILAVALVGTLTSIDRGDWVVLGFIPYIIFGWFLHLPVHRLTLNTVHWMGYPKMDFFEMGEEGYDWFYTGLLRMPNRTAFLTACAAETAVAILVGWFIATHT